MSPSMNGKSSFSAEVKVLDCDIVVSDFKLHSPFLIYFITDSIGKSMGILYSPHIGVN